MILFAIYKRKCAHLRKRDNSLNMTRYLLPTAAWRTSSIWCLKLFFFKCFSVQILPSWPSGNHVHSKHAVDLLWRIVTPSPKMFQDSRCCWASCCSPCWCWGTCHASRGTLVTAPMSVSATGLPTHLAVPGCHGIEFFSTYCDEYDPVEGVDGQILHYVSDRVGLQALFVWPNKTNKDV